MGMALLAVHMLMVAGNRYLRVSQARHEIQSQAMLSLAWLARELSETDPDSFEVSNTPALQGIVFGSPRDPVTGHTEFDTLGRMLWPRFICFYRGQQPDGTDCLIRKERPISPPSEFPPGAPYVSDLAGNSALNARVLARRLTSFVVSDTDTIPIEVKLQLKMDQALGKSYAIEVSTKVFPRN